MKIQSIDIAKINPAPYNPRLDLKPGDPEYDKLAKVISEFDLVEPLVWNIQTGNLCGGHQRLKILQARGDKTVEVSVVDLTLEKEKALNLALNKTGGDWDMPKLKDLLEELDVGDFDVELTGFDEVEIEKLMTQFHVEATEDDFDAEAEAAKITVCQARPGDVFKLGNHRIMCGDSTCETDVEKLMGGGVS